MTTSSNLPRLNENLVCTGARGEWTRVERSPSATFALVVAFFNL
jgi:hypothetical protein